MIRRGESPPSNSHVTFLVGDPYKTSFATIIGKGSIKVYIHIGVFPKIEVPPNHPF